MKTILVVFAVAFFSMVTNAQTESEKFVIEKGTWSLGGSFSVGSVNLNSERVGNPINYESFSFNVRPDFGYFIASNLQVGLELGYGYSKINYDQSAISERKINSFSIAPYLRKFLALSSKFSISLTGSPYYNHYQNDEYSDDEYLGQLTSENFGVNVKPGIFFMLSDKVSLNADIGRLYYSHFSDSRDGEDLEKSDQFGLDFSFDHIFLGLRYYIN